MGHENLRHLISGLIRTVLFLTGKGQADSPRLRACGLGRAFGNDDSGRNRSHDFTGARDGEGNTGTLQWGRTFFHRLGTATD